MALPWKGSIRESVSWVRIPCSPPSRHTCLQAVNIESFKLCGELMKIFIAISLILLSTTSFAFVDSKNCPDIFSITYYNISRGPLTAEIKNDWSLKAGWDQVKEAQKLVLEFKISTRSTTALCVYTNGKVAAFLQTNDGVDELMIPYNNSLYFRTKVLSFSSEYIELAVDEESKDILAPKISIDSDGGTNVTGEFEVGEAEAVNVQVL